MCVSAFWKRCRVAKMVGCHAKGRGVARATIAATWRHRSTFSVSSLTTACCPGLPLLDPSHFTINGSLRRNSIKGERGEPRTAAMVALGDQTLPPSRLCDHEMNAGPFAPRPEAMRWASLPPGTMATLGSPRPCDALLASFSHGPAQKGKMGMMLRCVRCCKRAQR